MRIETYTRGILYLYSGLFLFSILMGIAEIWTRIRKKTLKYWGGLLPCSILYLIFAMFSTFIASIAYDDPADPNYTRYKNWLLHDFILHDVKTFLLWLFIGLLLYSMSEWKSMKAKHMFTICFLAVLLTAVIVLFVIQPLAIEKNF